MSFSGTTLTPNPAYPDGNESASNRIGQLDPFTAVTDGNWRVYTPQGKVFLLFYMPASSHFDITVTSVPDKLGRTKDIVGASSKRFTASGSAPEIRRVGPFTPGLFNQKSDSDSPNYVKFTIANTSGAVKVTSIQV